MDPGTFPFIFPIIFITEKVLSGQRKRLGPWALLPAAAAPPELGAPGPVPPSTAGSGAHRGGPLHQAWGQDMHGGDA